MKKYIVIIFLSIFYLSDASAQLGVKAGVVNSYLASSSDDIMKDNSRTGFTFGVYYNFCLGCSFSLQPEILYTQKGQDFRILETPLKAELDYITVPVNIKYAPIEPLYIYAGPSFSFLMSDKLYLVQEDNNVELTDSQKDLDNFDLGLNIGVGAQLGKISIDARYTKGFSKVDNGLEYNGLLIEQKGLKNYTFQFTVGYFLF